MGRCKWLRIILPTQWFVKNCFCSGSNKLKWRNGGIRICNKRKKGGTFKEKGENSSYQLLVGLIMIKYQIFKHPKPNIFYFIIFLYLY